MQMPINNPDQAEQVIDNGMELTMEDLSRRMFNPKLMALRAQLPFISLMQFPNKALNAKLLAGVAQEVHIPAGTKMVSFSGNGEYYVSRNGKAQLPIAGEFSDNGSIQNPENNYWYVEEVKSLSLVSVNDCNVSVEFYSQM